MNYTIEKIINRVYNLSFTDSYDLAMFFLRYQEFYESPNPRFRNKQFQLLDFMEWYSKDRDGFFSYPKDWGGFNIPSRIVDEVTALGIMDKSIYDYEMQALHRKLKEESGGDYYLIGCTGKGDVNKGILAHELAHGMYYTIPQYKVEMDSLVRKLPKHIRQGSFKWLGSIGYTKEVFVDETQAYFSGGFGDTFKRFPHKKACKPFMKVYKEFKDEALRNTSKS